MSKFKCLTRAFTVLIASLTCSFAAQAEQANRASVVALLEVMDADQMVDDMMEQVDGMMRQSMYQALQGEPISVEQEAILTDMTEQMIEVLDAQLSWEKMEPMMISIYTQAFEQWEVDGMIEFYSQPLGQSVLSKMPHVMQLSMQEVQKELSTVMPEIQRISQETVERLQAAQ